MTDWEEFLSEADRSEVARGSWANRMGFGERPAVIVIDVQNYMVGEKDGEQDKYPYSCGAVGWAAVDYMQRILAAARSVGAPVIYTRFVIDPSGADAGVFARKVRPEPTDYAFFRGTHGAEIVDGMRPEPGELVIDKVKSSCFFGTPLLGYLTDRRVDTVIVVGGSTSNCVRATVVDSASYNFRTIVPAEAVFDRIPASHEVGLFDMNRTFADVLPSDEVVSYLETVNRRNQAAE